MNRLLLTFLAVLAVGLVGVNGDAEDTSAPETDPYRAARLRMVDRDIARGSLFGRTAVQDDRVLEAMRTVERHRFVPEALIGQAYSDRPLPIGHGQTISQPYIVAIMTELLELTPEAVVLEIGAGSGYHAAVVSQVARQVYTIEIVEPLGEACKERLETLGFDNIHVKVGDGYHGWPEHGPFDAIVVTAAASHIPPPLLEQLKPGGRMVIPVGPPMMTQNLMLVEKDDEGTVTQRNLMPVRFVPLTRTQD